VPLASLEAKVKEEIARIAQQGVEEQELIRVKRQAKAAQVFKQDSPFSIAMEAARLVLSGRPLADAENWLTVLDDIRSDDIARVANEIFVDPQLTVLEFEPLPVDRAARRTSAPAGMRH
jgi:zinc protease